ncbi:DNA/RNA non-specific endonuclease [Merismopedia glauca]|uniref:Nuclease n=1 Tax=Merismopedia glauca CCAP 1448/3 TaxID=1296344 RepID=A0A2T1C1S5_9CYAN|nr:DNA/RNA non-specific endonuclease [Merismopedia glauca]PSB02192.1 nuclease [Merismopedia glauca CCAP 1448/3]
MFNRQKLGIYLIAIALIFTSGCTFLQNRNFTPISSVHLLLGNPSQANNNDSNNYLIIKPQYVLSYDKERGIPNWVSWQLNSRWLGDVPRSNNFRPDDSLPPEWDRVTPTDYIRSGYDKGHMIPSGDRTNNPEDNSATFLMTNIIPQAADNNQGYWADLEEYCRELVKGGQELYIIAGSYGNQGEIAKGKVSIPARIYKIVVINTPGKGIDGISESTKIIAIDTLNVNGDRQANWRQFITTVDALEQKTGYDFLSNVKPNIQQVIESKR